MCPGVILFMLFHPDRRKKNERFVNQDVGIKKICWAASSSPQTVHGINEMVLINFSQRWSRLSIELGICQWRENKGV